MTIQLADSIRNNMLEAYECGVNGQTVSGGSGSGGSITGTAAAPKLRILTGAQPANTAAAQTGTLLVEMPLPADWASPSSSGSKGLSGTWQGVGVAAGNAAHYRIVDNAGTNCSEQGSAGMQVNLNTNALTAANSNVLNFASTTGVVVGMNVSGAGIVAGSVVLAVTGTTVTMSMASTAGVASGAAITFKYDLTLDNVSIGVGQAVTIGAKTITAPNP